MTLGISYWLLLGLFQSIKSERIDDQERREPNQGIRRSICNGLLLGITGGLLIGLMGLLSSGVSHWLGYDVSVVLSQVIHHGLSAWRVGFTNALRHGISSGLSRGFSIGMRVIWPLIGSSGLLLCAMNGGLAAWRHAILRLLLWHRQTFPGQALRFLDDATARILLRRVGGGYSFMHRLLLDYFADCCEDGD